MVIRYVQRLRKTGKPETGSRNARYRKTYAGSRSRRQVRLKGEL